MTLSPDALAQELAATGNDYQVLSGVPDTAVHVRFVGLFKKRPVVWDATLYTLKRYHEEFSPHGSSARTFIEIAEAGTDVYRLKVGLNLSVIDQPVIRKTIIMIRNYKLLRLGTIEWGEPISLSRD
jgi:hypothetical protein